MPPTRGGQQTSEPGQNRMPIVVAVVVLAIAAAIFSITRTVRSSQGENMGSMGGFPSKAELMKSGGGEEAPPSGAPASNVGGVKPGMLGGKGSR